MKPKELIDKVQQDSLTELDLFGQGLKVVPDELSQCSQLVRLNLGANKLTDMPTTLPALKQLESLSAFNNQIKTLTPNLINSLPKLRMLILSVNQLKELPQGFGGCPMLQLLDLSNNELTELRSNFGFLTTLKALYLSDNKLEVLPPEIGKLIELEVLVIRDNKLKTLPAEIGRLQKLKVLMMQGNKIEWLPPGLASCKLLLEGTLKMAGNPLNKIIVKELQSGIPQMFNLLQKAEYLQAMQKK